MDQFVKHTRYSDDFKVLIMEVTRNDLPEEHHLYRLPQISFSSKEKDNYDPVIWWTKDYDIKDLRKFLYEHSEVYPKIDKLAPQ